MAMYTNFCRTPAVKLMSLLPARNVAGNSTTNYTLSPTQTQKTNRVDGRIDQNIGSSDSTFRKVQLR
jgi:hypothetical protein